ncbi:hypothetical protein IE4803_CH02820 [Rhizobium etli bv. phaseoli str. IE4803]|nr:hypothetical protein IE4803_CH02820 [Rhizobium etli bv. phaseoli str. IE4803]
MQKRIQIFPSNRAMRFSPYTPCENKPTTRWRRDRSGPISSDPPSQARVARTRLWSST